LDKLSEKKGKESKRKIRREKQRKRKRNKNIILFFAPLYVQPREERGRANSPKAEGTKRW
jgi:hypothetical protein